MHDAVRTATPLVAAVCAILTLLALRAAPGQPLPLREREVLFAPPGAVAREQPLAEPSAPLGDNAAPPRAAAPTAPVSSGNACEPCAGWLPPVQPPVYSTWIRTVPQPDHAYVTYVNGNEWVQAAAVLLHSIAMSGSRFARAVCVTKNIGAKHRHTLSLLAQVIEVEHVPHRHRIGESRYADTFDKLRVWELTMFKKVFYVDVDVVVTRNMDDVFDLNELSLPLDGEERRYSTGMMLLEPSAETFAAMLTSLQNTTVSMDMPDLTFLNDFFLLRAPPKPIVKRGNFHGPAMTATHQRINTLPRWYQVYQWEFSGEKPSYLTGRREPLSVFDPRVHGIHYPGAAKPWQDYAARVQRYQGAVCRWWEQTAHAHDADFVWYVHNHWLHKTLARYREADVFRYDVMGELLLPSKPTPRFRAASWALFVDPAGLTAPQVGVLLAVYCVMCVAAVAGWHAAVHRWLASSTCACAPLVAQLGSLLPEVAFVVQCLSQGPRQRTIEVALGSAVGSSLVLLSVGLVVVLLVTGSRGNGRKAARHPVAHSAGDAHTALVAAAPLCFMVLVSLGSFSMVDNWAPIAQGFGPIGALLGCTVTVWLLRQAPVPTEDPVLTTAVDSARRELAASGQLSALDAARRCDSAALKALIRPAFDRIDASGTGHVLAGEVWSVVAAAFADARGLRERLEVRAPAPDARVSLDGLVDRLVTEAEGRDDGVSPGGTKRGVHAATSGRIALLLGGCAAAVYVTCTPALISAADDVAARLWWSPYYVSLLLLPLVHHLPLVLTHVCPPATDGPSTGLNALLRSVSAGSSAGFTACLIGVWWHRLAWAFLLELLPAALLQVVVLGGLVLHRSVGVPTSYALAMLAVWLLVALLSRQVYVE